MLDGDSLIAAGDIYKVEEGVKDLIWIGIASGKLSFRFRDRTISETRVSVK